MVMSKRSQQKSTNSLLAALPEAEYQRLSPHLERVSTSKGEVLHASDAPAKFVYFLEKGVASLSVSTEEGKKMQLSIVGNESVVGERAIFKDGVFIIKCAMLTEGSGHKIQPAVFHKEFDRGGVLHDLVLSPNGSSDYRDCPNCSLQSNAPDRATTESLAADVCGSLA